MVARLGVVLFYAFTWGGHAWGLLGTSLTLPPFGLLAGRVDLHHFGVTIRILIIAAVGAVPWLLAQLAGYACLYVLTGDGARFHRDIQRLRDFFAPPISPPRTQRARTQSRSGATYVPRSPPPTYESRLRRYLRGVLRSIFNPRSSWRKPQSGGRTTDE